MPMIDIKRFIKRPLVIALVLAALLVIVGTQQVLHLSADPVTEKDCPPLVPLEPVASAPTPGAPQPPIGIPWAQRGGTINDVSCLNRTPVYGIVEVEDTETIRRALSFARDNGLQVSIAGAKHSSGGQAFATDAVVLDMRRFNGMSLDAERRIVTVQSGATWHDPPKPIAPGIRGESHAVDRYLYDWRFDLRECAWHGSSSRFGWPDGPRHAGHARRRDRSDSEPNTEC